MPKEYIERGALIEELNKVPAHINSGDVRWGVKIATSVVAKRPTTDVVEVKHGEWRDKDWSGIAVKGYMVCSQCNVMIPRCEGNQYCLNYLYFCPNCGAKMDRKDK